jgi:hypothetical protein
MSNEFYAYGNESDLDTSLEVIRDYRNFNTVPVQAGNDSERVIFAKVDTGESGKSVTATEVVWNSTTEAFEAPTGTAWKWDTANIANDYTVGNLTASEDLAADQVVEVIFYPDKSEASQFLARTSGGGGSLVYATSPNTTFDASFTYGATIPFPSDIAANATALTIDASFYLSTPWNTRISAPDKLFAWWNKIDNDYYLPVTTFYVKTTATYPTSTGITTFTAYYNDSATFSLGTNTAFPSGVEVKLNGFTNASASSDVRAYFNGITFIASYDSENNIVYITHPRF